MSLPSVTLITPTGYRQAGIELAEKYVARQTYKGAIQWIVVSDDKPDAPTKCTMGQEYIQGPLPWSPGINTQRYNIHEGLKYAKGDILMIFEDDDYFKPEYIEAQVDYLKYADMVGECGVTYYSLRSRGFMEMNNFNHASTTQTAWKKSYTPVFYKALHSGQIYFDILLWNTAKMYQHKAVLHHGLNLCVGIKGILGRGGIGVGHQDNNFTPDKDFIILKKLVGLEDSKAYISMCSK